MVVFSGGEEGENGGESGAGGGDVWQWKCMIMEEDEALLPLLCMAGLEWG